MTFDLFVLFQITGVDQSGDPRQRLHEELGDDADPRDRRLHVSGGVCGRQSYYQGGGRGQHRLCYGR